MNITSKTGIAAGVGAVAGATVELIREKRKQQTLSPLKALAAAAAGASLGIGIEQAINGRKTDGKTLKALFNRKPSKYADLPPAPLDEAGRNSSEVGYCARLRTNTKSKLPDLEP